MTFIGEEYIVCDFVQKSEIENRKALLHAYGILGVPTSASQEEIRKAYRKLVAKWHPDRWVTKSFENIEASEQLRNMNEAFDLISDAPLSQDENVNPIESRDAQELKRKVTFPKPWRTQVRNIFFSSIHVLQTWPLRRVIYLGIVVLYLLFFWIHAFQKKRERTAAIELGRNECIQQGFDEMDCNHFIKLNGENCLPFTFHYPERFSKAKPFLEREEFVKCITTGSKAYAREKRIQKARLEKEMNF